MKLDLETEFKKVIKEYKTELRGQIEEGLDLAGNMLIDKLSARSPVGNTAPHFKDSWAMKDNYLGVRYVGNTKIVNTSSNKKGKSIKLKIPLINLIEYGSKGKPFVLRTYEECKNEIFNAVISKIGR